MSQRPLVVVGKGMAWSREFRAFIERTQIPFLRSPMGKGVMPDEHPCRSRRRAPWHCRTPTSSSNGCRVQLDLPFRLGAALRQGYEGHPA